MRPSASQHGAGMAIHPHAGMAGCLLRRSLRSVLAQQSVPARSVPLTHSSSCSAFCNHFCPDHSSSGGLQLKGQKPFRSLAAPIPGSSQQHQLTMPCRRNDEAVTETWWRITPTPRSLFYRSMMGTTPVGREVVHTGSTGYVPLSSHG
ncbi:unnamed protein product [Pylaiella littoralis]